MPNTRHRRSVQSRQRVQRSAYLMQNKGFRRTEGTHRSQILMEQVQVEVRAKNPSGTPEIM